MGKYVAIPSSYPLTSLLLNLWLMIGIWRRHLTLLHV